MQIKKEYIDLGRHYIHRLNDVRFLGQVIFVIVVLLISWSGVKSIQTNYGLQKQISALKQQSELQKLQNQNLELQNQYYDSNQYLDVAARQNFGLAAPGEKVIAVPESVALKYTVDLPALEKPKTIEEQRPAWQRNAQSWIDFFLHRQN